MQRNIFSRKSARRRYGDGHIGQIDQLYYNDEEVGTYKTVSNGATQYISLFKAREYESNNWTKWIDTREKQYTYTNNVNDFVLNLTKRKLYNLKMEQFLALQEAGLITVEQRERVGAIYRIIVGLTPEGEKYLKGTPLKQGSVAFVAMRGANEKVGKVISKEYVGENKGYAHYTVVLTNITPFGKILENFKEGDIAIENETMELIKDKEGKWKPYTVLDYMAK